VSSDFEATDAPAGPGPADSIERFAADLRRLKEEHDDTLTLGALAQLSATPKSTLSAVLNGKKLPTEKTLGALVAALDGDAQAWLDRRENLRLASMGIAADAIAGPLAAQPDDGERPPGPRAPRPSSAWLRPRWLMVVLLAVALAVGSGAGAVITWRATAPANPWDPGIVHTGDNPAFYPKCLDDAKVDAAETRQTSYLLEIIWSATCRAGWGRITRYDGRSQGNRIAVTTYLQADPDGPSTQRSDDADAQSSYTYLIASHSIDDRICVKGSVTDGATTIDLGTPLCL